MSFFVPILNSAFRLVIVVGINLSIFAIIPLSQEAYKNLAGEDEKKETAKRRIIAEVVKKKPQQRTKVKKSRIRNVKSSSGKSLQGKMDFKLSPDLAVAGGGSGVSIETDGMRAEVFEEGDVENPAVAVYFPQPPFPKEAKDLAISGEVKVVFIVGGDGMVADIEDIEAPHPSFEREIRRTFSTWKFNPATNNGIPVQSRKSIIIEFSLDS